MMSVSQSVDHRAFVQSLSPGQRAALTRKSDLRGALHLAGHWGLVALCGGLIAAGVPGWPLLLLPQAILLIFLFCLLHETSHRTVFSATAANRAVASVCGFVILLPPEWFRYFHLEHHRHTQDPERDPELREPKPRTRWQYVRHVSGIPVWKSQVETLARNALGRCDDPFVPRLRRPTVRREARVMIAGYALAAGVSLAAGSSVLLHVWLLPLVVGQPFLRLYLLAEHGRCPIVANMFENTRTTFTNAMMRALTWNMPYHTEHHVLPAVPFHRLPAFHRVLRDYLRTTENGYARFHRDYLAHLE
jgi:fatty acid desaturase